MIDRKHFDRTCDLVVKSLIFFCANIHVQMGTGQIGILPSWLGWICLLRAYDQMDDAHAECRSFSRFALWLAWYNGIDWMFTILGEVRRIYVLDAITVVMEVWIIFRTLCLLAEQSESWGLPRQKGLRLGANGLVILRTVGILERWMPADVLNAAEEWAAVAIFLVGLLNITYVAHSMSAMRYEIERMELESELRE